MNYLTKMKKLRSFIINTKEKLLNTLFPKNFKCIFCGRDIKDFDTQPYCEECAKQNFFNIEKRCMYCDTPIFDESTICDFCKEKHKSFDKAICPLIYKDNVRTRILKFKDDNAKYLAEPFARIIQKRLIDEKINFDYIIPVPLHKSKLKKRGYNQAEILAIQIGRLFDKEVKKDLIIKTKETANQKTLNFQQRQNNMVEAFVSTDKNFIKNKNFLIVDDVITTGATVSACASLLKNKGAKNVFCCAIARNPLKK